MIIISSELVVATSQIPFDNANFSSYLFENFVALRNCWTTSQYESWWELNFFYLVLMVYPIWHFNNPCQSKYHHIIVRGKYKIIYIDLLCHVSISKKYILFTEPDRESRRNQDLERMLTRQSIMSQKHWTKKITPSFYFTVI